MIGTVVWAEASSHPLGESAQTLHTSSAIQQPLCFIDVGIEARRAVHTGAVDRHLLGFVLFYYLPGCLACNVCLCMPYPRRPEEDIRPPELEFHAVVGHSMCAGNQTSGRAASVRIHWAICNAQARVLTVESTLSTDTELHLKYKPEVTTGMCSGLDVVCAQGFMSWMLDLCCGVPEAGLPCSDTEVSEGEFNIRGGTW